MATLIAVTGTYRNPDGTSATGTVSFRLSAPFANGGVIYHQATFVATLDGSGHLSQNLVANDDLITDPKGTTYTVKEAITGAPEREYQITVPHLAVDATVDLSTLMPNTQPAIGGS